MRKESGPSLSKSCVKLFAQFYVVLLARQKFGDIHAHSAFIGAVYQLRRSLFDPRHSGFHFYYLIVWQNKVDFNQSSPETKIGGLDKESFCGNILCECLSRRLFDPESQRHSLAAPP
jgi:hypothetical protein